MQLKENSSNFTITIETKPK